MRTTSLLIACLATAGAVSGCLSETGRTHAISEMRPVAATAEQIRPLGVGAGVPRLTLRDAQGRPVDLNAAIAKQPTVLVFYRGGWCMYCNAQLAKLQAIHSELTNQGYQILGISPDRPSNAAQSTGKHDLTYALLSDAQMEAARAFGVAFQVDETTIETYREYGINLEEASGEPHHLLPVPSVFLVGTDGVIRFAHANPDYKVRLDPQVLLAAAKAARP
jgi:peroxiredoxin